MHSTGKKEHADGDAAMPAATAGISVQRQLTVGTVNDPLEHEADAMADQVMDMQPLPAVTGTVSTGLQRKCDDCGEEENLQRKPLASFIQRKTSSGGFTAPGTVNDQVSAGKGKGSSMDSSIQSFMESRFGTGFNDVKIHTGSEAVQMSRELNAKAFTVGRDIYFNEGEYSPGSEEGKHLLAHELTHTVQQSGGLQPVPFIQMKKKKPVAKKKKPPKKKKKLLTAAEVTTLINANNKSTLSTELLLCLIWKESGFNPADKNASSSATGLMQMTKGAVEQVNKSTPKGIHFKHSDMTDPAKNIDCGTRYLQMRIDWANSVVKDGIDGFGTGAHYSDNILDCERCIIKTPADTDPCLAAIHS